MWPVYLSLGLIALALGMIAALLPREAPPPVRLPDLSTSVSQGRSSTPEEDLPKGAEGQGAPRPPQGGGAIGGPTVQETVHTAVYRATSPPEGKLIFVIDDVGNNLDELKPFLEFPGALTLSILPQRPYTLAAYAMIVSARKVPILHQPMEADGHANPGPGAIYPSMSRAEIDALLARNLQGMPEIQWVNNHEGSKTTSDPAAMLDVLSYLNDRDIHFLDSRTTAATAVPEVAKELGLPYYKRNSFFLDDIVSRADILKAIDAGLAVARRDGYAVMIGHVWDRELPGILIDSYPKLVAEGFAFAGIGDLLEEPVSNVGAGN
ncbi:MAG TPA: divergent polysaccharide deacetylase family protein [Spirochaetia bacterium]|nr:divergent polysaccharide deacetylase family protein [Spirochaetia bacterium]